MDQNQTEIGKIDHDESKGEKGMNLSQVRTDELVQIVAIEGGHGLRQKLFLRGIFEDSIVRVISCYGLITVEVDRNIVSIGKNIAQKIRVMKLG